MVQSAQGENTHIDFANVSELEEIARGKLDRAAFDYIVGGSEDEVTLRANRDDFAFWRFLPRVLRDVSEPDLSVRILDADLASPIFVAPTGFHQLAHPEGEVATAQGTADAGSLFVASTMSNKSLDEIHAASTGPWWLQIYVFKDRDLTEALIASAKDNGCTALVLTVDVPVAGRRERDHRNAFSLPPNLRIGNFDGLSMSDPPDDDASALVRFVADQFDASLTWDDVQWLQKVSGLPVLVKGILSPEDARLAVEHGADGVIVSNHGGRQLDSSVSAIQALPSVVDACDGSVPVLMDGGLRRGTDVVKALCLGADAVLVGRPVLWGLAAGGRSGVAGVLTHLAEETRTAMQLLGCRSVSELHPGLLVPVP